MPTIEINLNHLRHNLAIVRRLAPSSKVLAMVKANAYGHGLLAAAQALAEVDALGIARLMEAVELRQQGITTPLVVMGGFISAAELQQQADELNCAVVIHQHWQLRLLQQTPLRKPIQVWLKVNTGMNRLGLQAEELLAAYELLSTLPQVKKPIVVMTHFSDADNPQHPKTKQQWQQFQRLTKKFSAEFSCANSGAIISLPESHGDWVRPGLMLYGVSPLIKTVASDYQLKPVMTLSSRLIAINHCQQGDEVGYESSWICPEALTIGVAAIGYGDGYPRHIPCEDIVPVLVNGVQCNVVGHVSMDMMTIDLRHAPAAKIGDKVVLWGEGLPIERIASVANVSAYELLTHMTPRAQSVRYIE